MPPCYRSPRLVALALQNRAPRGDAPFIGQTSPDTWIGRLLSPLGAPPWNSRFSSCMPSSALPLLSLTGSRQPVSRASSLSTAVHSKRRYCPYAHKAILAIFGCTPMGLSRQVALRHLPELAGRSSVLTLLLRQLALQKVALMRADWSMDPSSRLTWLSATP